MNSLSDKINTTLMRSLCQGWDRTFLVSIQGKLENGATVSKRQMEVLSQIFDKCSEINQKKHEEWGEVYHSRYNKEAPALANYHITQRYYCDIAEVILEGGVPAKRKFMRMYENKYSQKVLKQHAKPARLPLGEYVKPRSNTNSYNNVESYHITEYAVARDCVERFMSHGGFIVGIEEYILSAAKGSKRYRILPPGKPHYIIVEERFLKRAIR
jgi:hypothetical protein